MMRFEIGVGGEVDPTTTIGVMLDSNEASFCGLGNFAGEGGVSASEWAVSLPMDEVQQIGVVRGRCTDADTITAMAVLLIRKKGGSCRWDVVDAVHQTSLGIVDVDTGLLLPLAAIQMVIALYHGYTEKMVQEVESILTSKNNQIAFVFGGRMSFFDDVANNLGVH